MFKNFSKKNWSNIFFSNFFLQGASPPHTLPPALRPWTLHAFGLRTLASQVLAQQHSRIFFFFFRVVWRYSRECSTVSSRIIVYYLLVSKSKTSSASCDELTGFHIKMTIFRLSEVKSECSFHMEVKAVKIFYL